MGQFHHLYNSTRWLKLRAHHLRLEPLCRACNAAGITTAADTVDHVKPHRGNIALFWDPANLQSTCRTCHSGDKQREEKGGGKSYRGCDANGNPLDTSHHWKAGRFGMVSAQTVSTRESFTYATASTVLNPGHNNVPRRNTVNRRTPPKSLYHNDIGEGGCKLWNYGVNQTALYLPSHGRELRPGQPQFHGVAVAFGAC